MAGIDLTERRRAQPYRELLAAPHVAALYSWALLARLPLGMTALGIVLLVRGAGGSYGDAGAVAACHAVARGVGSPVAGRLVDRLGQERVLLPTGLLSPAGLVVLAVLALVHAPLASLALCAAVAGALAPPVAASLRATWPRLLAPELRGTAYALDAALQEIFFLGGPLLVALLAAAASPTAALVAAAAAGVVGTLGFARVEPVRRWRPDPDRGRPGLLGALAAAGVRRIVLLAGVLGFAFGAVEVAMPAFAELHGRRAFGGLALAAFAGGSLVGGLLAGARAGGDPHRRLRGAAIVLAAALALPLAATSLPAMCALIFLAGVPIAPTFGSAYSVIDDAALPGTQAEAFAWLATAISTGIAAGTAAGGYALDASGVRAALLLGVGGGIAGVLALVRS